MIKKIKKFYSFYFLFLKLFFYRNLPENDFFKKREEVIKEAVKVVFDEIEIEGHLDNRTEVIFLNHPSAYDFLLLPIAAEDKNIFGFYKESLNKNPFFKIFSQYDIPTDKNKKMSIFKLIRMMKNKIGDNKIVFIFPEGTRNKTEKSLLPFQRGSKKIIEMSNIKYIQPVVILNKENYNYKTKLTDIKRVKIKYLDVINIKERPDWFELCYKEMEKNIKRNTFGKEL